MTPSQPDSVEPDDWAGMLVLAVAGNAVGGWRW